jgi:hypothetical protein
MGGIYSLGQIADESPRDHMPAIRVLAAKARQDSERTAGITEKTPAMQAILEVIADRDTGQERIDDFNDLDLRGIVAPRAYLIGKRLRYLNLAGAKTFWSISQRYQDYARVREEDWVPRRVFTTRPDRRRRGEFRRGAL